MQRGLSYISNLATTDYDKIFNVKEFGAAANGTKDDSAVFQKTINEAEGQDKRGTILIPPGDYRIDGSNLLLSKPGIQVIGFGRPRLILGSGIIGFDVAPTETSDSFIGVSPATNEARRTYISGLTFKKVSGATPTSGIKIRANVVDTVTYVPAGVVIEECYIHEMNSHGIHLTTPVSDAGPARITIERCWVGNNTGDGIRIDKGGDSITIRRTDMHDNTGNGLYADLLDGSIQLQLEHCALVRNATSEITWKQVPQSRILWCGIEQQTTVLTNATKSMILLDGHTTLNREGPLIFGCNINGNSATETTNGVSLDRFDGAVFMGCRFAGSSKAIKFSANSLNPLLIGNHGVPDSLLDNPPKSLQRVADDIAGAAPLYRSLLSDSSFKHEYYSVQSGALRYSFGQDASGRATHRTAAGFGHAFQIDTDEFFRIDDIIADTETCILVRRNVGGTITVQRVSMGSDNSGGAGFKVLRVPN